MKTVIETVNGLLQGLADVDERLYVRIVTRNSEGNVVGAKVAPVGRINTLHVQNVYGALGQQIKFVEAICIEESEIKEVNSDFNVPFDN